MEHFVQTVCRFLQVKHIADVDGMVQTEAPTFQSALIFFSIPALYQTPKSCVVCALDSATNTNVRNTARMMYLTQLTILMILSAFSLSILLCQLRNMVMSSVDAAKVQTGCYRRIAQVIKEYCNLTMS